ncbi:HAD family hydrolase [Pseudomonas syringae]|uniref:Haloacid dehalogenase-like hydrolase n=1 Tax=Pseudomonas syringae TaxID=317 RepID=A0AB37ZED3_PSESX|nr:MULTISPECIES: HAD family hydrolase [Pseudomonas]MBI6666596.1 HAD family hydrolase [Pseudomonas syringae]MBI6679129.1 HAD family hydrolase [Pseudomonas syringae]MBI6839946.1 HAD family hydrolase [Pseudomonas syringae]SDG80659.1 haloacid dehalogenase-like hydrolase [Pseudomonas sp. BS3767]SDL91605.1 haloacid dehalogenase-like hydrolase [Pseudomonas syringae]
MTKTAISDAFGTVVRIGRRTTRYRQLLREGIKQGRRSHPGDAHVIMMLNLELNELAEHVGILLSEFRRNEMECALQAELNSIEAYPDAIKAVAMLRERGVALGISSNLAKPYGAAVEQLFPSMNTHAFSFENGAAKPDPRIYQALLERLDPRSGRTARTDAPEVWIVGDLARCDRDGARARALVTPTVLNQARRCSPLS